MSLTKLTDNLNNVSSLPDKPTLNASELKEVFDASGIKIKEYINTILTEEIDKEIKNIINIKANVTDLENYYNKTEIKNIINIKANVTDLENYYNKTEINNRFAILKFTKDMDVKNAQYPEGFTRDNCIVVSVMRSDYNPKKMWSNTKHCTKQIPNGDNEPITIGWNEPVADVTLHESYIGLSNWDVYYDYRVVLMKI